MKKIIVLFFLFVPLVLPVMVWGQVSEKWVARYNGPANNADQGRRIALDDEGFVYVTGVSNNGSNFDYLTIKYNPISGDTVWARRKDRGYGDDVPRGIAVTGDAVYVTGESWNGSNYDYLTIKYNKDTGNPQWSSDSAIYDDGRDDKAYAVVVCGDAVWVTGTSRKSLNDDIVTIKYRASDGYQLCEKTYNHTGYNDYATAIATDGANVYVTGGSFGTSGFDYITIAYRCSDCTEVWSQPQRYDGPGVVNSWDFAWDIVACNGGVYVTGESEGFLSGSDYATVKYRSSDGYELWVARYNGKANGDDKATAIAVDSDCNVWVTGTSLISYDWAQSCIVTIKYNSDGSALCTTTTCSGMPYVAEVGRDVTVDTYGNAYVTGTILNPQWNYDYVTIKYSSNCSELWTMIYNGPGNGKDDAYAIAVDYGGKVYITGESRGGTNYDYATIKYSPSQYLVCPDGSGNFTTIQEAIDAASDGDTILLCDATFIGEYNRDIDFHEKAITVRSQSGNPDACIIDCQNSGLGFYFHSGEGPNSVVTGFSIVNGNGGATLGGGGILCDSSSSPTIRNCKISNCNSAVGTGGIYCRGQSSPTIDSCLISGNGGHSAGGISCDNNSSPTIRWCIITGNRGYYSAGGINSNNFCYPTITHSTISGNGGVHNAGGIQCLDSARVENTIIWGNCAGGLGDEVYLPYTTSVIAFTCCDVDSSGIEGPGEPIYVANNIFTDPRFCAPESCDSVPTTAGDYSLYDYSPCIQDSQPICGLIGALGLGCGQGRITVTYPNGGEYWYLGSEHHITWDVESFTGNVNIEWSRDGGASWEFIVNITGMNKTHAWTVPDSVDDSDSCLIRISDAIDGVPADTSDSCFTVYFYRMHRDAWSFPNYNLDSNLVPHADSFYSYMWPEECWPDYDQEPYNRLFHRLILAEDLLKDSDFPSWPLWVAAFGKDQCYIDSVHGIFRPRAVWQWRGVVLLAKAMWKGGHHSTVTNWWGSCIGFAISSYLFFDDYLSRETYFPGYSKMFDVPLDEYGDCRMSSGRQVVNTYLTRFFGWQHVIYNSLQYINKTPSQTLHDIEDMFKMDYRDHRPLCMSWNLLTVGHIITPIKITTHPNPDSSYVKYIWVHDNIFPGSDTTYCCPGWAETTYTNKPIRVRVDTLNEIWTYEIWPEDEVHDKGLFLIDPVSDYLSPPDLFVTGNIGIFASPTATASYHSVGGSQRSIDSLISSVGLPVVLANQAWTCEYTAFEDSVFHFILFTPYSTAFSYTRANVDSTDSVVIRYFGDGRTLEVKNPHDSMHHYDFEVISASADSEFVFEVHNISIDSAESALYRITPESWLRVQNYGGQKTYNLTLELATSNKNQFFLRGGIHIGQECVHLICPNWATLDTAQVRILVDCNGDGVFEDTLYLKHQNCGDVNGDGVINVTDVVYLINYLFLVPPGPPPVPLETGDVNCDAIINVSDVVYLINCLFAGGPCPSCF